MRIYQILGDLKVAGGHKLRLSKAKTNHTK
jgi:hypothetical protein